MAVINIVMIDIIDASGVSDITVYSLDERVSHVNRGISVNFAFV